MNQPNKNVGGLYQLKLSVEISESSFWQSRFCFVVGDGIDNKAPWSERCLIDAEVLLMLVKSDMDLTMETTVVPSTPPTPRRRWISQAATVGAATACVAAAAGAPDERTERADYDLARKQWEKSKCIPGSVFMAPAGRLIWISDIDFKHFEEVKL